MINNIKKQYPDRSHRSLVLRLHEHDIDSCSIKWAETREELGDAFKLVYDEYQRSGYIQEPKASNMFLYIHHLLPDTAVLLMMYNGKVVSTLSLVLDSDEFGLPMDSLYREELDALRKDNRKVMEACALATSTQYRSPNMFSYLFRKAYWHAVNTGITDICAMVNPKHVPFYRRILLFEGFGIEKNYPRVGAPAVALRVEVDQYKEKLKNTYSGYPAECNLYSFVYKNENLSPKARRLLFDMDAHNGIGDKVARYFFNVLPQEQRDDFVQKMALSSNI